MQETFPAAKTLGAIHTKANQTLRFGFFRNSESFMGLISDATPYYKSNFITLAPIYYHPSRDFVDTIILMKTIYYVPKFSHQIRWYDQLFAKAEKLRPVFWPRKSI